MSKVSTKILILLTGIALIIGGASAADPVYQIGTDYLSEDRIAGLGYYILNGTNLTLPLNITYISDDNSAITRLEVNTTISQNNARISDLLYKYRFAVYGSSGEIEGEEWIYQFAGGPSSTLKGVVPEALVLNITNLPYSETPYSVEMNIYAGSGLTDFSEQTVTVEGGVKVYHLYPEITETNENGEPKWNLSNPLAVTTTILTGVVPAGTYTIPWDTYIVSRGTDEAFPLFITEGNTTASVWKLSGENWQKTISSSVTSVNIIAKTLSLTIGDDDAEADGYKIVFEGKQLGDVTDLMTSANKKTNIADVDIVLHFCVSQPETGIDYQYIPAERCVYGDVNNDGSINTEDAELIHYYTQKNKERT